MPNTSTSRTDMGLERIKQTLDQAKGPLLNVFFTAGYPAIDATIPIVKALSAAGANLIEIGMPYSDPIADGPVIQHSSEVALSNGMNISLLLEQLEHLRQTTEVPVILMGYLNPIIQYGIERFLAKASAVGIDGLILPDLPPELYERSYKTLFEQHGLANIMLISPQTPTERIRYIDNLSSGFIYAVSSASTTGNLSVEISQQAAYFQKLAELKLQNRHLIGFGIKDKASFAIATQYSAGAIIGSAFIKLLADSGSDYLTVIEPFIKSIKP